MNEYAIVVKGELPGEIVGSSAHPDHLGKSILEEKIVFQSCGYEISGIVTRPAKEGARRDFIVFLHGFAGNKDENGLFKEAARRFAEKGYNSLRFDFFGHGESTGESIKLTIDQETKDFKNALEYIREEYRPDAIYALGFSLGAFIALNAPKADVNGFILWSPALKPCFDMYPRYSGNEVRRALDSRGWIDKSGLKIGPKIIDELRVCDIEPALEHINKPMLIIHGTKDERISISTSETIFKAYCSRIDINFNEIQNAGHSYKEKKEYREEVYSHTMGWLSSKFSSAAR
jgi:alpha-beta hydrolase superfamily lysophospholipase